MKSSHSLYELERDESARHAKHKRDRKSYNTREEAEYMSCSMYQNEHVYRIGIYNFIFNVEQTCYV